MKRTPDKTVLIVDDDAALRASLEFSLRTEGYAVRSYANGEELMADAGLPDRACLVIDQRLPDTDGLTLIEAMRGKAVTLPAILITTHPSASLRRRAARAAVPIVEKPLITGTLFERIGAAFG